MGEFATRDEVAAQAKAQRDETFHNRRDDEYINGGDPIPTATPTGPDSQSLLAALGHWAEWDFAVQQNTAGEDALAKAQEGQPQDATDRRLASNEIHNHYMVQRPEDLAKLRGDMVPYDKELDLSTADSRIAALDNLVQNTGERSGELTCAASSLLGAAIMGGKDQGTEGISILLDTMTKNASPEMLKVLEGEKDAPGALTEIRKKIAAGEQLDVGDMHVIQTQLYNELQANETKAAADKVEALEHDPSATEQQIAEARAQMEAARDSGIQAGSLRKFIGSSPEFTNMMKDNDMGISFIQNDPDAKTSNHAILTLGHGSEDGAYTVYDPQLRDDGQVITDPTEIANYRKAETNFIAP